MKLKFVLCFFLFLIISNKTQANIYWLYEFYNISSNFNIFSLNDDEYQKCLKENLGEQDYKKAVRWHRLAAEQGSANAQYNLGNSYRRGKGVPQDYKEAFRWYRLSAEQGYERAQDNLGVMYSRGYGVPQDYKKAA